MMRRRTLLSGLGALAGTTLLPSSVFAITRRSRPGDSNWPTAEQWTELNRAVGGSLEAVMPPDPTVKPDLLANPIYRGDQPALVQFIGYVDAWTAASSAYVVRASNASDVAAAVRFASKHNVRVVVKGGGHSYMGGSNAPDSLLIWTRDLQSIEIHDAFTPQGGGKPMQAVSVGAGCLWGRVYDEVTTRGGRYVQGGGCTTVGVAGLVQGGGFGSYSKTYGLAAASLLEAEIVTADGVVRTVNARRDPDLFWALKGGGGGTFGVVTRLTLQTHALPENFGAIRWTIQAKSDDAYRRLLARFLAEYAVNAFNPHWGEQVKVRPDNRLVFEMLFQGMTEDQVRSTWRSLESFIATHSNEYEVLQPLLVLNIPARQHWDMDFVKSIAGAITVDSRPGARPRDWWWTGDGGQSGAWWHGYESAWLPATLLLEKNQSVLADAWFEASRQWGVSFHFNKGLAGATPQTLAASRDTSMNPDVLSSFALAIMANEFRLDPPNLTSARNNASRIKAAMSALRKAAPDTGNYLSECSYFVENWQKASFGKHYARLRRIKKRYDAGGLFIVHHGVGSEDWSADGFTQT